MNNHLCRFCLKKDNLSPIFMNTAQCDRYSVVLCLVTGLKVELNDGLPQLICVSCMEQVNKSLAFRNQSHRSEMKLISLGYERNVDGCDEFNINSDNETQETSSDIYIKPEVPKTETDRQPAKMSKKEKRAMYMELVEGEFDPNGPVTCKICHRTVKKWSCFISHAKIHLGFKFVCEFCGKSFISSTQLKRHCRSFHGMARELRCQYCSYLALDTPQLVLHERRTHTGERPFVCESCGAAYASRRCLIQHEESHRECSLQCPQCPALVKSRRHLARHRYSVHRKKPNNQLSKLE